MYRAVPQLRGDLVELFERESVDAGDIILESVDDVAREATDYATTDCPVGLLVWAIDIVRPFSSFVRQILTMFGLETDRLGWTSAPRLARTARACQRTLVSTLGRSRRRSTTAPLGRRSPPG